MSRWTVVRFSSLLVGLSVLIALAGCSGESVGMLQGTVTLDGKPVPGGSLAFVTPKGGTPVTCFIGEDGKYAVEGVPSGEILITVFPPTDVSPDQGDGLKRMGQGPNVRVAAPAAPKIRFPERYQDAGKSGLKTTVKGGVWNTYDIPMTK